LFRCGGGIDRNAYPLSGQSLAVQFQFKFTCLDEARQQEHRENSQPFHEASPCSIAAL
jgi:hypothetical protein